MPTIEPKNGADNIGGGCYLILAEYNHVIAVPVPTAELSEVPPLELLPNREFTTVMPTIGTLQFVEEPVKEKGTTAHQVDVSFSIPKNHKDLLRFQNSTKGKRYIAVFVDMNGSAVMIGNSSMPVELNFTRDFGADSESANQVLVTISKVFPYSMPFYMGMDTPAIGDFNYDFNIDFAI